FNHTSTSDIYTLSLHDALPILKLYKQAGIKVYVGGTLFEAFIVRNKFDDYLRYIDDIGMDSAEVSDGSIEIEHDKKCEYINTLRSEEHTSELQSQSNLVCRLLL